MPKYRSKPVVVEAEQFFVAKKPWPKGVVDLDIAIPGVIIETGYNKYGILMDGGAMHIYDGEWLVVGDGYIDTFKPAIFEQTYEIA